MTNIKFPETNLVRCVFSLRQSKANYSNWFDEYDHLVPSEMASAKQYVYALPDCLKGQVHVGDFVLVHCQTGYQVCEVVEINALSDFDPKTIAPVVCKVDLGTYIEEVERKKALAAIKKQIEKEKKRLEAMVTYELIAEKNPEFKEMLEAFKDMGGEF